MKNPPTNPSEIARDTLKQLAVRRIPPTPDNYLTLYHEIAGTKPSQVSFPEKHLRSLAESIPRTSPEHLRLARQLDQAIEESNWDLYRKCLADFFGESGSTPKPAWATLIGELVRQWETRHQGVTTARKREALEHVISSTAGNPENLFNRLQNLVRSWGENRALDSQPDMGSINEEEAPQSILPELRELFAQTLETAIATQLVESPRLSEEAAVLAADIRQARNSEQLQAFLARLKRFTFKLELLCEDRAELRESLLNLLRLLVENVTELVMDDGWVQGQIEIVRDIIDKPLSQRNLDDAERRLKEVIYKQSQLKHSLREAQAALKNFLAGFVDHLAEFAGATSDYHDKIEACASRIGAARDISELEDVLQEVMHETRVIQLNAQRSRDELLSTQAKAEAAEARIHELETELDATSKRAMHDHLTGALNRRGLDEILEKEIHRAQRHETSLCIGLLDIDNFKKLNDLHGHSAGDAALVHLADTIKGTLRPQDTVARYGGEEFVILFPETDTQEALVAMTRVQRELTRRFFLHDNQKILITFSAGIAELQPEDNAESLTKHADAAMYQAKQTGKNKVVLYDQLPSHQK